MLFCINSLEGFWPALMRRRSPDDKDIAKWSGAIPVFHKRQVTQTEGGVRKRGSGQIKKVMDGEKEKERRDKGKMTYMYKYIITSYHEVVSSSQLLSMEYEGSIDKHIL